MIIYTCVAQQDEMASFNEAILLTRQALINAQLTMSAMRKQLTVMTLNEMGAAPEQITQALLELQQAKSAMGRHFDADLLFVNSEVEIFRIQHNAASLGCTAFYDDDLAAMRIQISNDAKRKWEATDEIQAPVKIPRPQPGHHDFACYPSVEESHEGPVYASSEAHARQQGLHGVGEDAREVEGPLEASSEAHARQQGLPGVGEQDAREVGGYDDDEAD
jgi:hypothetical protein